MQHSNAGPAVPSARVTVGWRLMQESLLRRAVALAAIQSNRSLVDHRLRSSAPAAPGLRGLQRKRYEVGPLGLLRASGTIRRR